MVNLPVIENKGILTKTGGFLGPGFTHTLNAYSGCAFAQAMCGTFCYAQHNNWTTKGRKWSLYGVKGDIRDAYRKDFDRLKRPKKGEPKPLRVYMSSSTDPYVPHELTLEATKAVLDEMLTRPPDALVIQTHTTLISRDMELIVSLAGRCKVWVSITVETGMDEIEGFPRHAYPPAKRIDTLKTFRDAGVPTQATVSPLLPLRDVEAFAGRLGDACDRVILDHYLIGDGSNGLRTRRTSFPAMLATAGFGEWNDIAKFRDTVSTFRRVLGSERVLVSSAGFNAV